MEETGPKLRPWGEATMSVLQTLASCVEMNSLDYAQDLINEQLQTAKYK